jgi:hypothetical protein
VTPSLALAAAAAVAVTAMKKLLHLRPAKSNDLRNEAFLFEVHLVKQLSVFFFSIMYPIWMRTMFLYSCKSRFSHHLSCKLRGCNVRADQPMPQRSSNKSKTIFKNSFKATPYTAVKTGSIQSKRMLSALNVITMAANDEMF